MKSPYVSELQSNQVVTATFLVQHKDIRQKKTGEPYLSLVLGDRTGEIDAKMWDNVAEVMDTFERDDFLKVRGLLQVYQNKLQLTVHKLQRQGHEEVDFTDYFPASQRHPDEMFAELLSIVAGMRSEPLRALLNLLLSDPEIARRYKIAPAAKSIHHAYLGGLVEHVLSLCGLARLTAAHYPYVDMDLLLTGVILHDIGKIYELTYDRSFGYSTDGQLLGHIIIGLRMVEEKSRQIPNFPQRLLTLVEHMVISHHGELEFGSPKTPLFPEAMLLHHLDNMDSKMETMRGFLHKDRQVDGYWTGYSPSLERAVLKKDKFLSEEGQESECPVTKPEEPAPQQSLSAAAPASTQGPAPAPKSPPKPPAQPEYKTQSLFGEKLQGALTRRE
jgi:3'-5' exoribonuclease